MKALTLPVVAPHPDMTHDASFIPVKKSPGAGSDIGATTVLRVRNEQSWIKLMSFLRVRLL